MIQEPLTPQIPEQQQKGQFRTEYITEPLKSYPIQTNTLSLPVPPRILLIKSSATSPIVTQLVAQPRKQAKIQTRIIRIPFLPSSEPIAVLMKQSLPTEKGSVKNSNQDTELIETTNSCYPQANINYRHLTERISSNTCNYSSNLIGSDQRNQNCYQILYLNQSQNKNQTKSQELPPQKPMTLASMAGIQLTSADESHTMEMSGAMQPTATVEEIKVPVFIDEYLQQSTQTSSTTTKTTPGEATSAATIINNNNYNQYYCENNDNNHNYNGIICLENETFETLDFDIEMIAEDTNNMMNMTIGENMENNHSNFYYCTNNSSNNKNNTYNDNNTYTNNNNTYNGNNNIAAGSIAELEPKVEPQFHTSPGIVHDFLSEDLSCNLEQDMATANILSNEEAIDISHFNNDFSLFTDAISSSQNDPMFTEGQKFTQELQKSEPIIEPDDEYELYKKQDMQQFFHQFAAISEPAIEEDELDMKFIVIEEPKARPTTGAKRKQQQPSMQEKRRKLRLNTKVNMNNTPDILNTPDLVRLLVEQEPHTANSFETISIDDIMNDLLDISNSTDATPLNANANTTCWTALIDSSDDTTNHNISTNSVITEAAVADHSNDSSYPIYFDDEEDPPYTPSSSTTHTIPTGLTISSSPNSPALSTISAATTSSVLQQQTQKKRRGRPSKEHSDKPDPQKLALLPEAVRKRFEDRAKNNEASRISRKKNKQKEEAEVEEQEKLMEQNVTMKAELAYLEHVTKKLKCALHRRQMLHKR